MSFYPVFAVIIALQLRYVLAQSVEGPQSLLTEESFQKEEAVLNFPQRLDNAFDTGKQILNEEFDKYIDKLIQRWDIHGVAVALVKPDGGIELGAWGNKTERGDPVKTDV